MVSDQIMELLLEEQEVPLDLIHKTIREATDRPADLPGPGRLGLQEQGRAAPARRGQRLPAQPARPRDLRQGQRQRHGRGPPGRRPRRAAGRHGVQARRGAVRPGHLHADLPGDAQEGRVLLQLAGSGRRPRISRILRVHADEKEDIDSAGAGDIVAVMGIECATGDTYCDEGTNFSLESIYAAEPVIDLAISPDQAGRPGQALQGPEPVHARGPDLPRPRRPGDERDDHLRHGRAAPGDLRRADPPRVQGRVHRRHARRSATARRRPRSRRSTTSTGSRPAARASTPTSSARWSRCPRTSPSRSSSRTRSPAAASRASTSPRSRRASATSLHKGPVAGYEVHRASR